MMRWIIWIINRGVYFIISLLLFYVVIFIYKLVHYLVSIFFFGVKAVTIDFSNFSKLWFSSWGINIKVREPHTIRETISQYNKLIIITGVAVSIISIFVQLFNFVILPNILRNISTDIFFMDIIIMVVLSEISYLMIIAESMSKISEWGDIITALIYKKSLK